MTGLRHAPESSLTTGCTYVLYARTYCGASEGGEVSRRESTTVEGLPPGPRIPRAAQTALLARGPISFLERCRERHGELFTLRTLGLGTLVVVANPQLIKDVFSGDRDVFHAGEANAALGPVLGEHSLLLLDGEQHLLQRRLMLPPFHGEAVRAYG